jgi:ferrous iron transport protein B
LLIGAFLPVSEFGWWLPPLVFFGLYMIGLVAAPLVALVLKRTLLRGEAPVFVMEMPLYKVPSLRIVGRRAFDAAMIFFKRAGTLILASMVIVWALMYFPRQDYEEKIAPLEAELTTPREKLAELKEEWNQAEGDAKIVLGEKIDKLKDEIEPVEKEINRLRSEWRAQSILGKVGKSIEPIVEPLGWDWRIGMAALASFPAREVMVGTLGIIFGEGEGDIQTDAEFRDAMNSALRGARRPGEANRAVFTIPVALSVMVFFALCCQCVSTLVVIKRETNSWRWPTFTFVYMTLLAYAGAFVTYQVGSLF